MAPAVERADLAIRFRRHSSPLRCHKPDCMSKPKLFSTHPLFDSPRRVLAEHFEVEYWDQAERPPRAEILRRIADKDALICLLTEKVDQELIAAAPKLKIAANVAVGYDNIDVDACTRHRISATNTPGVLDETTADFTWTLLMAVARRLIEGDRLVRSGLWRGWNLDHLCGADVYGKTLGLVGFGRIGRAVARRAKCFGMRVIYTSVRSAPLEKASESRFVTLDTLLTEADFISLHVPLRRETHHLIGSRELAKMKTTAFIVNTSRGPVVNEEALVRALHTGQIAGAALDVYEHEPNIHPGLLGLQNVVLAPHAASASIETRTKMAVMAAENCVALFTGRTPPNMLNPEVLVEMR